MPSLLRSQQIIIDLPRMSSEPWIHITVQRVEMDDNRNIINTIDRWGEIHRQLFSINSEIYDFQDPLAPGDGQISALGLAGAITAAAVAWIVQEYGGDVNEQGDIIVG